MPNVTINTDCLYSQDFHQYLCTADRRIVGGIRRALAMLGIPCPTAAAEQPKGRPRAAELAARCDADTGTIYSRRHQLKRIGAFAPKI